MEMRSCSFNKNILCVLLSSMVSFYLLSIYFDFKILNIPVLRMISMTGPYRPVNETTKTILFWNSMFGDETFYFGVGDIFNGCPVNNCYATHDRTYTDVEDFDAILFHINELSTYDLPSKRSAKQRYVFVNLESPGNRPISDPFFEDYFNATMTYRFDSDILWSYAVVKDAVNGTIVAPLENVYWKPVENDTSTPVLKGKSKMVAWLVSNCNAPSGRLEYVEELSKYLDVTTFGKCGDQSICPKGTDCFKEVIEPHYFFYLSFENTLCQDYVTEKLYNPLRHNVVPVVYGGANYSLFAPPDSYVDALDFESPRELAVYLKKLAKNPQEYQKYFRWKKWYRVGNGNPRTACNLCEFLHRYKDSKIYNPMSSWYSTGKCPMQDFLKDHDYATKSARKLLS